MLGARHTRAPTATKRRAAHQQSVPGETQSSSGAEIALQAHRRFKQQPVATRPTNTRDNQMATGKCKNINQGNMATSESNSLITASPGDPNTPENHDLDLKSHIMMLLEDCKKDMNKSLKEIRENMNKVEALTKEKQKSLKEIQENMGQHIEANKRKHKNYLKKCRRNWFNRQKL